MNSVNNIVLSLIYNSMQYKNPTFSEEKEWRLVYNPFGYIRAFTDRAKYYDRMHEMFIPGHETGGFIRNPMEFQIKKDKLVSYIDLSFKNIKNSFIKEIIIGSKANLYDMDLELFLLSKG